MELIVVHHPEIPGSRAEVMDAAFDETYKGLGWVKGEAPKPSQSKPSTAPTGGNP